MINTYKKTLKLSLFVLLVFLIVLVYVFRTDISYKLANYLIVNDKLENADAIAVLGGETPERIMEAVKLYKDGYSDRIILTRGVKPNGVVTLASQNIQYNEEYQQNLLIALQMGADREDIVVLKPRVEDTVSELETIHKYAKDNNFNSLIIVTSKYHSRRTSLIADHIFGNQIKLIIRSSRYDSFNPEHVLEIPDQWKITLLEYEKIIYFYIVWYL